MCFSLRENMCSVRAHCMSVMATVTKGGRGLRTWDFSERLKLKDDAVRLYWIRCRNTSVSNCFYYVITTDLSLSYRCFDMY